MATIENKQRAVVGEFTQELIATLDGVTACTHVAGIGEKFGRFRRGREATRPPVVTLEPTRQGLFLGLVVSRPSNGRLAYSKVLGRWDFANPIRAGGPLDATIPSHRRAAFWAVDMAERLLAFGRARLAGTAEPLSPAVFPRILIPFKPGEEKVDQQKFAKNQTAFVSQTHDRSLVDAAIVVEDEVARAIDENRALEDHRPVLGQQVKNPLGQMTSLPFAVQNPARGILARHNVSRADAVSQELLDRMVHELLAETTNTTAQNVTFSDEDVFSAFLKTDAPIVGRISFSEAVCSLSDVQLIAAARAAIGTLAGSMSDEDVLTAVHKPQQDMTISYRSRIQIVPVESLQSPPWPYAGSALPPVNWTPVAPSGVSHPNLVS